VANIGIEQREDVERLHHIGAVGTCQRHVGLQAYVTTQGTNTAHNTLIGEVLALSDMVGSTAEILAYAAQSNREEFIIVTETGVDYALIRDNPGKRFYFPDPRPCCKDMKLITVEKVYHVLKTEENEIFVSDEIRERALLPLDKMLELAKRI
jgi:quinolinate synthase